MALPGLNAEPKPQGVGRRVRIVQKSNAVLALYARVITDLPDDQECVVDNIELQILRRFAPQLLNSATPPKRRSAK
jgi:hypothetical protein